MNKNHEQPSGLVINGIVVQAGTDCETGKPRIIIETTESQLRDIKANIMFKPCRVEMVAPDETAETASCKKCGERLKGISYAWGNYELCGLCLDDLKNGCAT